MKKTRGKNLSRASRLVAALAVSQLAVPYPAGTPARADGVDPSMCASLEQVYQQRQQQAQALGVTLPPDPSVQYCQSIQSTTASPAPSSSAGSAAAASSTPSTSSGSLDLNTVCGGMLALAKQINANKTTLANAITTVEGPAPNPSDADATSQYQADVQNLAQINAQKMQYCVAAYNAQNSANGQNAASKIWTAASATCVSACAMSFMSSFINPSTAILMNRVCTGADLGATGASVIITKDIASAATSVGMAMVPLMMGGLSGGTTITAAAAAKGQDPNGFSGTITQNSKSTAKPNHTACLTAATASIQAYTLASNANSSKSTVQQNLQQAAQIGEGPAASVIVPDSSPSPTTSINTGGTTVGGGSSGSSNPLVSAGSSGAAAVQQAASSLAQTGACNSTAGSGQAVLECATASGAALPAGATTPAFSQAFQTASNTPLGNFLGSNGGASNPSQDQQGALQSGAPGLDTSPLAQAEAQLEQLPLSGEPPSAYASGGGGGGDEGEAANPMGDMLAKMMGQLMPKNGETGPSGEKLPQGSKAMGAGARRIASEIDQDRTTSLFERVTQRYIQVGNRLFAPQR